MARNVLQTFRSHASFLLARQGSTPSHVGDGIGSTTSKRDDVVFPVLRATDARSPQVASATENDDNKQCERQSPHDETYRHHISQPITESTHIGRDPDRCEAGQFASRSGPKIFGGR